MARPFDVSRMLNKEFGPNGVALAVQIGSYCSYVQHLINKTIPFRPPSKHSKLALIE